MMEYRIYAGTYAGADENGIFRYRMDGNVLINREIFDEYLEQFHEK